MREVWIVALAALATSALVAERTHAAGPKLIVPVTSADQVGLAVSGKARAGQVSAMLGMWSEDGALELGGFREGPARGVDPGVARAAELVSGKRMRSSGVRLTGSFYRPGGWALSLEARRQQVSDIGAALSGAWRTAGDSRLTIGGKLKF
jgi:hypothetical protein